MHDLDHAAQTGNILVIDLITSQKFRVVAEIAQEPVQLPQCLGCAVEASTESIAGEGFGLKHSEQDCVVGLLRMPAILHSLNANQEKTIGQTFRRSCRGLAQARYVTPHAAPACDRE